MINTIKKLSMYNQIPLVPALCMPGVDPGSTLPARVFILSSYTNTPRHAAGWDSEGGTLQI